MTDLENLENELAERRRLRKMRLGQEAPEFVTLRDDPDVRVALVPLTEAESEQSQELAARLDLPDNPVALQLRDRWAQVCDMWYSVRFPNDLTRQVFTSPEKMTLALSAASINQLSEEYLRMMDYSNPSADGLTDEAMDELKKACLALDWSALSGKAWWHLKNFLLSVTPEHVQASLPGLWSTLNSIEMSEDSTSIPTVPPS